MNVDHRRFLSEAEITELLARFSPGQLVPVTRIRYKNKQELRKIEYLTIEALKEQMLAAIEEGHQYGGDIEFSIPGLDQKIVGHHDGIYWFDGRA